MSGQKEPRPKPESKKSWTSFTSGYWQLLDSGNWLANRRDIILISAAIVYFLGYLVWALNAWIQGLGILPAADLQYFVAGLGPAITLALALVVARAVIAAAIFGNSKLKNFLRRNLEKTRFRINIFFGIDVYEEILAQIKISFSMIAVAYVAAALVLLVFVVYPQVPQELGGFKPRCAYLELDTAKVSDEALNQFFPNQINETLSGVERTGKVDILFNKGGVFLIRPKPGDPDDARLPVYEMKGDTVRSVVACS